MKIHKGFFFVQLCLLPITISKIQALLAGELYKEKKECFTQRKRRFEGLQRFSLSGEERMFHTKKTTIRRFTKVFSMRGRKNVSHKENEDSKVYKGFLYEEKKECFARRKRRFEGSQRFLLQPQFLRYPFDTSSISR